MDYYGIEVAEAELRRKCKTKPDIGTHPISLIEAARSYNLDAQLVNPTFDELKVYLKKLIPVIVNILKVTEDFHYHHSVVVESIRGSQVTVLDPEIGVVTSDRKSFELVWEAVNNLAIIVQSKR